VAVWNLLFSLFLFAKKLRLAIHFLDYISSRCPLLVKRCFRNCIETSNFKQLGLVQVKSGSQLQIHNRHYGPSKKKKIPPELTNRYVKNEAFIVVVFNNILTLLLTIRITILSDCYCCCFQVRILTRLTLLSLRTLLPIVSVATHLPTAFQYSKDIQISGHLNI